MGGVLSCCGISKWGCCRQKNDRQVAAIKRERSCTDLIFLLLYVLSWLVVAYFIKGAMDAGGDPNKIVRGVDMHGRICGVSEGVEDKPLAAWPYPLAYKPKICVSDCSHTNLITSRDMAWRYRSQKVVYYCLPTFFANTSVSVQVSGDFEDNFQDGTEAFARAIGDLQNTWRIIGASVGVALIVSFVFVFFLRFFAGMLVLMCITLLVGGGSTLGYFMLQMAGEVDPSDTMAPERVKVLTVGGWVVISLTGVFLLVCIALYYQIRVAVEVIKEAARAIGAIKSIVLFPALPLTLALGYFAFWLWGAFYIFSVSDLEVMETPKGALFHTYEFGNLTGNRTSLPESMYRFKMREMDLRTIGGCHLFHLLWSMQVLFYFGYICIAGALADWYFTPRTASGKKLRGSGDDALSHTPLLDSFARAVRYHLGTVVVAALIIAIVQMVRAIVMYIERKTKSVNGEPNAIQKAVLCLIKCCLRWVECCLDKINKNGLIWTSIYGDGFCVAACSAFALIWRNLLRVAAINAVSIIIFSIGKFSVAFITMAMFGYALTSIPSYVETITSPAAPCIVIFILSFVVAKLFFLVFETVVDTTFFCFLVDSENNEKGQMLASPGLQKLVGKYEKKSKDKAKFLKKKHVGQDQPLHDSGSDDESSDDDLEMADL